MFFWDTTTELGIRQEVEQITANIFIKRFQTFFYSCQVFWVFNVSVFTGTFLNIYFRSAAQWTRRVYNTGSQHHIRRERIFETFLECTSKVKLLKSTSKQNLNAVKIAQVHGPLCLIRFGLLFTLNRSLNQPTGIFSYLETARHCLFLTIYSLDIQAEILLEVRASALTNRIRWLYWIALARSMYCTGTSVGPSDMRRNCVKMCYKIVGHLFLVLAKVYL